MQYTPAVEDFLSCWRRSGLVAESEVAGLIDGLAKSGVDLGDPKKIATALVRQETLTKWQAENLLRGKRRGFVLGKYRLLSLLGRGGNSSVYLGEHSLMRRRCAIKVLPTKNLSSSSGTLARFQQEARAVALLDHTNIVRAYDLGQDKDGKMVVHFLVMELVDGESFEERVAREGPLPAVEAANLIRQAALGLAHAHTVGIIHRDIKPANLLVDRQGVVKILDLGLAKMSDILSADESGVMGTADFLAPEQALDGKAADARSDVYSLGCTFYYILCGRAPFSGGTLPERLVRHLFEAPINIARKRPDLPADLDALVHRMLAKNPSDRIQSCTEVANLLHDWLVQHADPQWLRANPELLARGRSTEGLSREATTLPLESIMFVPVDVDSRPESGFVASTTSEPRASELVPVMEQPSAAGSFLGSEEFRVPISPVTRSLMQQKEQRGSWWTWLLRAYQKLQGK
jgi:eukaryotic-like serine/threonine-protein kinase